MPKVSERERIAALEANLKQLKAVQLRKEARSEAQNKPPEIKGDDAGPSWTCPHCNESNPGNFNECWKCRRLRTEPIQR